MSSPNSVNPNTRELNNPSSPPNELDRSYDSREAPEEQEPVKVEPTVKKPKRKSKKQSVQLTPEEAMNEFEDLGVAQNANNGAQEPVEKKKKKKVAKKTDEIDVSELTATFPRESTERKGMTENSETTPIDTKSIQNEGESEPTGLKPKKKKKKVVEIPEDVNEAVADVIQEEKPKKAKKKAVEKKEEVVQVVEVKKTEVPVVNNVVNTQEKAKSVKKPVEPVAKEEKPKEVASPVQKTENIRTQSKQGSRNGTVESPAKSVLVSSLVSPSQSQTSKSNGQSKRPLSTAENERPTKSAWNPQVPKDEDDGTFVPIGKARATLRKSPTEEELSAVSPKSKLGPIKSRINTGLTSVRTAPKTIDVSTVSMAVSTRATKNARTPDATVQKKLFETAGQRSYVDSAGTQKSFVLEKVNTMEDLRKKRKEKPRMRSFDSGKTDKIRAADSFETRNKMWMVRKAEKLLEEEKKKSREQNEACTFNPQMVTKRAAPLDVTMSSVYDRGLEWSQKVKTAVQTKSEQIIEETTKAEPKKPRIKSAVGPPEIKTSKVYIEGFTGPQFGVPKTMNVPAYSQEPLKFSTNLDQKIGEIYDVYDSVSAALKKKSAAASRKEMPKPSYPETKSASRISVSTQQKDRLVKAEPVIQTKGDDQRMSTLKQMLNVNQKDKKSQAPTVQKVQQAEAGADYLGDKVDDAAERIVPRNGQRVEIRNNRYVIVDDEEN